MRARCQDDQGRFAYQRGKGGKASLTGAGVLCLQIWKNAKSEEAKKGLEWIVQIVLDKLKLSFQHIENLFIWMGVGWWTAQGRYALFKYGIFVFRFGIVYQDLDNISKYQ